MSKRQTKASTSKREKKANGLVKNMTSLLNHIAWPEVERKMKVHHANYFSGELEQMLSEVEEERKNFKALLRDVAGNDKVPGTPKRNKPGILARQIMENYKQIVLNFDEDDESTLNASAMTEQSEAQTEQTASKSHFSTIPSTTMHSTDVSDMTLRENTNAMSMSNVDDTPKPTAASTPCNENAVVKKKPATKSKHDETTPLKREKSKQHVGQKHCECSWVDQAAKRREEIMKDKAERVRRLAIRFHPADIRQAAVSTGAVVTDIKQNMYVTRETEVVATNANATVGGQQQVHHESHQQKKFS
jgi:hypothetical protein